MFDNDHSTANENHLAFLKNVGTLLLQIGSTIYSVGKYVAIQFFGEIFPEYFLHSHIQTTITKIKSYRDDNSEKYEKYESYVHDSNRLYATCNRENDDYPQKQSSADSKRAENNQIYHNNIL